MRENTKILVIYTAMIPTARLVTDMMDELKEMTKGKLRAKKSVDVRKKDVVWADLLLFVRGADPYMEKIAKAASPAGRYCVMYLDDDLLNVPSGGIETYKNALKGCLYWCDLLWSSNVNILKKYSVFMKNPKCVEEKVFAPIGEMLPALEESEEIKIVYAGSVSHAPNLQEYLIPALNSVYEKYHNIHVTFIGLSEKNLSHVQFPVEYIGWFSDMQDYRRFVAEHRFHIGFAVVKDTEFYRCKYYNKFLEYGKMGVIGIYSDCEPYQFIVKDGENGLLCPNTAEGWEHCIERAVIDGDLRRNCIENAQKLLREEFVMEKVLDNLLHKAPEFSRYKADNSQEVDFWGESLYIRFFNFIGSTKIGFWLWGKALDIRNKMKKGIFK